MSNVAAEKCRRNRGGITIGDDMIGLNRAAIVKPYRRDSAALHFNLSAAGVAANVRAVAFGKLGHCLCDMVYSAFD